MVDLGCVALLCKDAPVDAMGKTLPMANKYLFAFLYFFTSKEDDEATSVSFAIRYATSSALLKGLYASYSFAGSIAKEITFLTAIKLLIAAG